jgi:ybaK/ebsC protein
MGKSSTKKTNAMRTLDRLRIAYSVLPYEYAEQDYGTDAVAEQVGLLPSQVFKTLVLTAGGESELAVCCLPVDKRLDLKALAAAAGEKRLQMLAPAQLLQSTGYVRGGCSPIGMKRPYPTFADIALSEQPEIAINAGQRGLLLWLSSRDLMGLLQIYIGHFVQVD